MKIGPMKFSNNIFPIFIGIYPLNNQFHYDTLIHMCYTLSLSPLCDHCLSFLPLPLVLVLFPGSPRISYFSAAVLRHDQGNQQMEGVIWTSGSGVLNPSLSCGRGRHGGWSTKLRAHNLQRQQEAERVHLKILKAIILFKQTLGIHLFQ